MDFVTTFIYDSEEYTTKEEALKAFESQINNSINENGKHKIRVECMAAYQRNTLIIHGTLQ